MDSTSLQTPYGTVLESLDLEIIDFFYRYGSLIYSLKGFQLASNRLSSFYCRFREELTDNPNYLLAVGRKICLMFQHLTIPDHKQVCLIGIPSAGFPFAAAASSVSFQEKLYVNGQPICYRVMKERPKSYGAHRGLIHGDPNPNHSYWDIDNVLTNGASKIAARENILQSGYPIPDGSFIWMDRNVGGTQVMKADGMAQIVIAYNLRDVLYVFGQKGYWKQDQIAEVLDEAEINQIKLDEIPNLIRLAKEKTP